MAGICSVLYERERTLSFAGVRFGPPHAGHKSASGGSLPLTIAEIPRERLAIQKLAVFSRFVPTNALVFTNIAPRPEWSAIRRLAVNGLMGSSQRGSTVLGKVNSLSPNPQLLIALHSPNGLRETGLRICRPEKSQDSDALQCRVVRSLQSGLSRKNREIRACFAHFGETKGENSLHFRLRGGEGGIRTLGTALLS